MKLLSLFFCMVLCMAVLLHIIYPLFLNEGGDRLRFYEGTFFQMP